MGAQEEINRRESIWEGVSIGDNGEFFIEKKSNTEKKNKNKEEKKKKKDKPNPKFPEEIIVNILIQLPLELLHKKFMYVCKQWNSIISSPFFINQSMLRSNPIRIIQNYMTEKAKILEVKVDENHELVCYPCPQSFGPKGRREFKSSCNGLLLISICYSRRKWLLQVMNPVTKQVVTLPRCPSKCRHLVCGSAITFSPSTGDYKVIHVDDYLFGFEIFTLGCLDNTWRRIPWPFKDIDERPFDGNYEFLYPVLVNDSMLHWNVDSKEYIISMDIRKEELKKTYLPIHKGKGLVRISTQDMVDMGGFLSVFYFTRIGIDVWILKDFEKQVWIKQHSIVPGYVKYLNPVGRMPKLNDLRPVSAIGRVILFRNKCSGSNTGLYKYDMDSRTLKKFKMKAKDKQEYISHVNTLHRFKDLVVEAKPNQINPSLIDDLPSSEILENKSQKMQFFQQKKGGFLTDGHAEEELGEDEEATPNVDSPVKEDFG